jgi:hypothetical protein
MFGCQRLLGSLTYITLGELAQLGERLLCTQEVIGSIPLFSTISEKRCWNAKLNRSIQKNVSIRFYT